MDKKGIGYFVGGLVIGAGIAGVSVWRYSKAYFTKVKNEAIDELCAYYHGKYGIKDKEEEKIESSDKKESNDEVKTEKSEYEGIADIYKTTEESRTITNYNNISTPGKSDSRVNNATKKKSKKKKPYMIDKDIFEENEYGYDKLFVAYYEADNTFVNEESDEVVDVLDEIGQANLDSAENYDGQIFVANDQLQMMYMVTVEHAAWCEEGL